MKVHFIGAEGVSMRLLMELTESYGHSVSGSDEATNGHDAARVCGCDLVVFSGAVGEDNAERREAERLHIPQMERAQYLGLVSLSYGTVVAVAGSHGKTTATAMTYRVFEREKPTLHLGGRMDDCTYIGDGRFFITEACEYRRSLLQLTPKIGVVLNAELDHTDYYKDLFDIQSAFAAFVRQSETALVNGDDPNLKDFRAPHIFTFGLNADNDFAAADIAEAPCGYSFSLFYRGDDLGRIQLTVPGAHNIYNALSAAAAGVLCDLPFAQITEGLYRFSGAKRRFECVGRHNGAAVYSDYAHHPTELAACLSTARKITAGRLIAVFEPHTFTRTRDLFDGFVAALSMADEVVLAPVYRSRETDGEVGSLQLKNALEGLTPCAYCESYRALNEYIGGVIGEGDTVVYLGAGSIDRAARELVHD